MTAKNLFWTAVLNAFLLWRNYQNLVQAPFFKSFLYHTHLDARLIRLLWTSDQPLAKAAAYTTRINHMRRTSIPSAGFESAIPAVSLQQTYTVDRTATADDLSHFTSLKPDSTHVNVGLVWEVQSVVQTEGTMDNSAVGIAQSV